jgi:hypothetical protein
MKIDDRNLTGTSATETGRAQDTQNLKRAGTGNATTREGNTPGVYGSNDSVEFSGTLSRLSRTLATFESTRTSRIQALSAQYISGKYKPDSAATSKGLVSEAISAGSQAGLQ